MRMIWSRFSLFFFACLYFEHEDDGGGGDDDDDGGDAERKFRSIFSGYKNVY